jgi:peptidyl-prolyl cis-trans isomerase SurA
LPLQADHRAPSRFAGLPLLAAALAFSGCHRPPSPDVVATVNGKQIVRVDLERYYKASLGDNPQQPSPEQADIGRLTILHEMIEDEILQQRAAKLNLAASDEDVNATLTEIKAPFTQEEFDNKLKQREMTLDDLKRDLRKQLTKTKLLNKEIESRINITDAEIAGYFAAHKAEFNLIEPQYRLAQIVVTAGPAQANGNPQDSRPVSDADARKKIESLRTRLDNGEDFGAVAMNSDDPNTAQNGGDMGFVQESALRRDPPVYDAIGKLKPGAITDILPIVDGASHRIMGYAIYKLISREPAGQRELNDPRVQQTIRQGLRDGHAQLLKNAYFEKLHDEAKVHNYLADQILKLGAQ